MTTKEERIIITKYDLLYEQRMTRVETAVENISETLKEVKSEIKELRSDVKADFKWLIGLMITFSTVILGILAKGFHWV